MSRQQEWILRESTLAYNKRDIEGIVARAHPEIEFQLIGTFADVFGQPSNGHEGLRTYFTNLFTTCKAVQVEHKKLFEVGEQLVTLTVLTATVWGSSVPMKFLTTQVWNFKDFKISHWYVLSKGFMRRPDRRQDRDQSVEAHPRLSSVESQPRQRDFSSP